MDNLRDGPALPRRLSPEERARQNAAMEREVAYGVERAMGRSEVDTWNARVRNHCAELECANTGHSYPEPHSCVYCQKVVFDMSNSKEPFQILGGAFVGPREFDLHCSLKEAEEGARGGCEFLQQLLTHWQMSEVDASTKKTCGIHANCLTRNANRSFDLNTLSDIGVCQLDDERPLGHHARVYEKCDAFANMGFYTENDDPAGILVTNRPIRIDPWSSETIEMIRMSLDECNHCREERAFEKPQSSEMLGPGRLLAISKSTKRWVLMLTNVENVVPSYCTLSYCWGSAQKGLTTSENVKERLGNLDYDELSKTIQDAIIVSWDLGFRYLWVDALCIVQNDENDYAAEVSKMSHIFAQSDLTICASRALFADEGFLLPRIPFERGSKLYRLAYQLPNSSVLGSVVLCKTSAYSEDNRLETRAWGFQERIMSNRILDFDGTTTSFFCAHMDGEQTQMYRDGGPRDHNKAWRSIDHLRRTIMICHKDLSRPGVRLTGAESQTFWSLIVRAYTEREVTNSTDRALAIAGVAERCAKFTEDIYLAGLWARTLPYSLMWSMRDRDVRSPRSGRTPSTYQGPSWSWLAVNQPVHFFHADELRKNNARIRVDYIAHELDLEYEAAPYGSAKSASLALQGKIRKACWIRRDGNLRQSKSDYLAIHKSNQSDWPVGSKLSEHDKKTEQALSFQPEEIIPVELLPDALEPEFAEPIGSGGSTYLDVLLFRMFDLDGSPVGLALRDPGEDNEGFYERVGIFHLSIGAASGYEREYCSQVNAQQTSTSLELKPVEKEVTAIPETMEDFENLLKRWNQADTTIPTSINEFKRRLEKPKAGKLSDDAVLEVEMNSVLSALWGSFLSGIGKKIDADILRQSQKAKEDALMEKWKGWFDQDDCEERVIVLV